MPRTPRFLALALLAIVASIPSFADGVRPSAAPAPRSMPTASDGPSAADEAPAAALGRIARHAVAATATRSSRPFATQVEEGLRVESATRITLDPAATAVHVAYEATLTNQSPPDYGYYYSSYSVLPRFGIPMLVEATNVSATRLDGAPLTVTVEPTDSPFIAVAVVDLDPDLYYQDTGAFRLTYDLPQTGARSTAVSRLNDAFASFPVFAIGDPGISSVEVTIPERFDVELIGSDLDRTTRDGQQVYTSGPIADPEAFGIDVVARDDDKLVAREVEIGGHDATVLAWPGDQEWLDFVSRQVEEGIPHLEDALGSPWPYDQDVEIIETVSPYLYGYAGWFQLDDGIIEVGDELDQEVILHELSHAWFNDELYDSRWINEGLADEYAARAVAAMGGTVPGPDPVTPATPGAQALNVWDSPDLQLGVSAEAEAYGYDASWTLVRQLTEEIGLERMSEVVRAADERRYPYGTEADDNMHVEHTWQQFLDLLVDLGGSTTAEATFRAVVASPEDLALMDQRLQLRTTYEQLRTELGGWEAPFAVRRPMSKWQWGVAANRIDDVRDLLPLLADVRTAFDDLGLEVPAAVRTEWEQTEDVRKIEAGLREQLAAVRAYADAVAAHPGGPLAAVGLAGRRADLRLLAAGEALADGDAATATRVAEEVTDLYEQATASALARAVAVALLLGLVVTIARTGTRVPDPVRARLRATARAALRLLRPLRRVPGLGWRTAARLLRRIRRRSLPAPAVLAPPPLDSIPAPLPPPVGYGPAAEDSSPAVVLDVVTTKRAPRKVAPTPRAQKPKKAPPRKTATPRTRPTTVDRGA